jgi:cation diffusion facilitator family transporter
VADNSAPVLKSGILKWSIATASFLTLLKFAVGLASSSMGLLASAVDSLMDVFVSSVNFISLREADKPPDHDHAYGHGKIESLASLFQSLLIGASGFYLITEAAKRLVLGETIELIDAALAVMVVSMIVTFLHVRQNQAAARQSGSLIVGTERLHFATDIWSNLGIIAALLLVRVTGNALWDLAIAVIVAAYIMKQSYGILRTSIDELIDRALPDEVQEELRQMILGFDKRILGVHNLRTRKIANRKFIEFHVELDKTLTFEEAHNLTEDLIEAIEKRHPDSDVNAHFDPEGGR